MTTALKKKPMKLWAGFVDGKLDMTLTDRGFGGWGVTREVQPAIFRQHWAARRMYQDVRAIEIREIPKGSKP
jgi:hypothetical protein